MLLRVYHQGYGARMEGLPCTPPAGYDGMVGVNLAAGWIAGWEEADREFGD